MRLRIIPIAGVVAAVGIASFVGLSARAGTTQVDSKSPPPGQGEHLWSYPNSPSGTVYFPRDGFRLEPADPAQAAGAMISTSDQALSFLASHVPIPSTKDISESGPEIWFGYFTNDVSGSLQPDGTLKLIDEHELAWFFTWTLSSDFLTPLRPQQTSSKAHDPGECIYFGFVTTTGMIPVAGQNCGHAGEPAFLVK